MDCEINWIVSEFEDLTTTQLYEILHLRSKIFVVEQSDVYLDVDYLDQKAVHVLGYANNQVAAYCRVFKSDACHEESGSIGRVLIIPEYRACGLGQKLVAKALDVLSCERRIQIAAQLYLQKFYEGFGFEAIGNSYLDGSIEHIDMVKMNN